MAEEFMPTSGFTRRSFIKGAAVLTAAGALAGCSPQTSNLEETDPKKTEAPETQIFAGSCRGACMQGCLLDVHVRDGQVVRTTARDLPDSRYNRICSKGLTHPFRMYSAERLQYPMRRVGERGEAKFERISWDEAIASITENWKKIMDEYGTHAVAAITCGGNLGSPTFIYSSTLAGILGLTPVGTDFDAGHQSAMRPMLGGGDVFRQQNENADLVNSKTIVAWGFNPVVSHVQTMHFINEARENGTRFIVIDPVFSPTAQFADWFIPINAGTDAVLAMSVLGVVIENDWHDVEFLKSYTEAGFLIKEDGSFLLMSDLGVEPIEGDPDPRTGKPTVINPYVVWDENSQSPVAHTESTNPQLTSVPEVEGMKVKTEWEAILDSIAEYDPETAAGITGISAEDIRELARVYGEDGPVNTYNIYGFNHYFNAHQAYRAVYTLGFATGNVGKPGAATGTANGEPYAMFNLAGAAMPKDEDGNYCQGSNPVQPPTSQLGSVIETGEYAGQPFPLKAAFVATVNFTATNTDRNYTLKWLNGLDFVVVADIVMSETAKYADIILPVAHWFEQEEALWQSINLPFALWQDKVADPLYESKTDLEIAKLLADAMGYTNFPVLSSQEEYLKMLFDTEALRKSGITLERLKEEKAVRIWTADESELIAYKNLTFSTPSRKISFYRETPFLMYNMGQEVDAVRERCLAWDPPKEAYVGGEVRKVFPYHCISERQRHRTHTQWQDVGYLNELYPEPVCKLNPKDAEEHGLGEGDKVKLFNDHGSVVVRVAIHAGVPQKTVVASRGYEMEEYIEGHFGNLSTHEFDNISKNQVFLDCAVDIDKVEGGE